jgi:hypothetical protein
MSAQLKSQRDMGRDSKTMSCWLDMSTSASYGRGTSRRPSAAPPCSGNGSAGELHLGVLHILVVAIIVRNVAKQCAFMIRGRKLKVDNPRLITG